VGDVEASTATTSTQRAATISPEHAARPPLQCPNHARCTTSRKPYWWSLFQVRVDWPFCVAMSHPDDHSWSRKPSEAAMAAEFHVWQGQSYDQQGSSASPDVVLGMFVTSSHPATILFDSGTSHSFISSSFVAKQSLPIATMKHTMLVSSPGGEMRTKHICPAVSISIRG
jgi:hypothetical protein